MTQLSGKAVSLAALFQIDGESRARAGARGQGEGLAWPVAVTVEVRECGIHDPFQGWTPKYLPEGRADGARESHWSEVSPRLWSEQVDVV